MSPARSAYRPFAVAAAVLLAVVVAIPAQAASPGPGTPKLRHVGPAWQRPTADDPDGLIVTFRPGTTPAARSSTVRATGTRHVQEPAEHPVRRAPGPDRARDATCSRASRPTRTSCA